MAGQKELRDASESDQSSTLVPQSITALPTFSDILSQLPIRRSKFHLTDEEVPVVKSESYLNQLVRVASSGRNYPKGHKLQGFHHEPYSHRGPAHDSVTGISFYAT